MEQELNIHIGICLKQKRIEKNLTQTKVAKALNVTFQQIQKYEKGLNGINSASLFALAKDNKWDINLLYNGDPNHMIASVPILKQDMVVRKFREIRKGNIRKERKLQSFYSPILPQLERELAYENTYKEPVADPIKKSA